jgi:hypothetical protein
MSQIIDTLAIKVKTGQALCVFFRHRDHRRSARRARVGGFGEGKRTLRKLGVTLKEKVDALRNGEAF